MTSAMTSELNISVATGVLRMRVPSPVLQPVL
jgi:hypothetical protein